jgi:hypothetical protein
MSPELILNPRDDQEFAARARELAQGAQTPRELEDRLRETFPGATVRARDLSGERTVIWYVYRDGHWTR